VGMLLWVGGVVVSEFYLFLVVFPARCVSSVSTRFYFRKHAFCFLPLVTILESLFLFFFQHCLSHGMLRLGDGKRSKRKVTTIGSMRLRTSMLVCSERLGKTDLALIILEGREQITCHFISFCY
jgi:hypothetical protein